MFELDGYVYGGYPSDTIKITEAKPLDDMIMILTFSSGERRLFDDYKVVIFARVCYNFVTNQFT